MLPSSPRRTAPPALAALMVLSTSAAPPAGAAPPVDLSGAHWIWYPDGDPRTDAPAEHRYFRRTFTVAAGAIGDARFVLTGDDSVDVWLNGEPLASSTRGTDSWRTALSVDLRPALVAG